MPDVDLLATARFHERMEIVGPSETDMDAVDRLQVALKALGDLCVQVMTNGSGDWARVASELDKAAAVCRDQCKVELPPACRSVLSSFRPSEVLERVPIYENRAAG